MYFKISAILIYLKNVIQSIKKICSLFLEFIMIVRLLVSLLLDIFLGIIFHYLPKHCIFAFLIINLILIILICIILILLSLVISFIILLLYILLGIYCVVLRHFKLRFSHIKNRMFWVISRTTATVCNSCSNFICRISLLISHHIIKSLILRLN